ncbi:hypothetical protein [Piscinibacter terrae]|uniref:hypothetical protein n=1 Tax=Piscinibacter terrae TaxID=2496871 RepID=UPI000F59C740|nr:hypothetical protein [Albitalea terrae]
MSLFMRSVLIVGCIVLVALLSGCMRIPLGSLWALKQFSFETFEPATLRLAMQLPQGVALKSGSLVVDSKIKREGEPLVEHHFVLHESKDRNDFIGLPPVDAAQGRWVVLKFDADEAARIRAMRQGLAARKTADAASGVKGKNSVEIGAAPKLCRTGAAVNGSAKVSGALYWEVDKGYVKVLRETSLDDLLKDMDDSKDVAAMPVC